ncbi:flagellar hook-length control protein FliK [Desulfobulbus propionicus]
MDLPLLIPEIKPLVPSGQLESRSQRLPFSAGQILHATVSSQEAPNQFTLKMDGQDITVESSGGLRIGQNLAIEVTSLIPQLQLRIVADNPATQRINTSLHLLANQGSVYSQISSLTESALHTTQLSAGSQQILQQMRSDLETYSSGKTQLASLIEQIATHLQSFFSQDGDIQPADKLTAVGQLLQELAQSPVVSSKTQEQAADLAKVFLNIKGGPVDPALSQAGLSLSQNQSLENQGVHLADLLQQAGKLSPSLQILLQSMLEQPGQRPLISDNRLTQQLLPLLVRAELEAETTQHLTADGQKLQQTLHKVGLNLEQLLAEGNMREATGTLKFALLELSNLPSINESQLQQANDLVQIIQLSQLLQIRLSTESIFFLPLPFPFLHTGFLLVDNKKEGQGQDRGKSTGEAQAKNVSMHLQLEGLGNLRIEIHQDNDQIALTFYSEDAERARFIGEHREELQNWLTTGQLRSAQFLIGSKEPTKVLIEKLLHGSTGMINTSA